MRGIISKKRGRNSQEEKGKIEKKIAMGAMIRKKR